MWPNVGKGGHRQGRRAENTCLPLFLGLLTLTSLLLVNCNSVSPVVKIGLVAPFEGRYREIGYDVIYSARLAVRQVNASGGIGGYRVALVALDDGGEVEGARETAESLTLDPAVILVMGHWLTATTAVAAPIYAEADIPFMAMNHTPFLPYDAAQLPVDFRTAYEAVTPFDEVAGKYAGATYDAFQLIWLAMARGEENGRLTRQTLRSGLDNLDYEGMTGRVYWRNAHE